jgi:hypothetical protein
MKALAQIMQNNLNGYNGTAAKHKHDFHRTAQARMKELAAALGLTPSEYDIRSNRGGVAVSGEVTLHSDTFYCQIDQSVMGPGNEILFRSCKGRDDYCGGSNHFAPAGMLDIPEVFARDIRQMGRFGFELVEV